MPAYETDREQLETLKKWWSDNGTWLLIAIVVGLVLGFSWRYWQKQQLQNHQHASLLYQQLSIADSQNQSDTVLQINDEITKRYPKTEYAALANLIAAKNAVLKNNQTLAVEKLQWTKTHSQNASIQQIARIREARVLLSQNKLNEAQKTLATINDKSYQPVIDEVMGDIYIALGNPTKARQSYQSAQTGLSAIFGEDVLLSMQLAQPQ